MPCTAALPPVFLRRRRGWGAFGWLCRRQPGFATGLAYGIGHGGLESIALVGVSLIGNTVLMLQVNAGGAQALVASVPPLSSSWPRRS